MVEGVSQHMQVDSIPRAEYPGSGRLMSTRAGPSRVGLRFDPASVTVEEIRKEAGYGGVRVVIAGELAKARCKTQIDVRFGDAMTPGPVGSVYPVLLDDLPAPRLRAYPTYTVVAEKLHAIALLGMANSRVKNYFDLSVPLERETLEVGLLAQAIKATFERWSLYVRLANPRARREAITSRPWLMTSVGRRTEHAGQTTITLTSMHGEFEKARDALVRVSRLLQGWVQEAAEQLNGKSVWHRCCEHLKQILAAIGPPKKVPAIGLASG